MSIPNDVYCVVDFDVTLWHENEYCNKPFPIHLHTISHKVIATNDLE